MAVLCFLLPSIDNFLTELMIRFAGHLRYNRSNITSTEQEHVMNNTIIRNMTEGSILRQLVAFSLPLLVANSLQTIYTTVDTLPCLPAESW